MAYEHRILIRPLGRIHSVLGFFVCSFGVKSYTFAGMAKIFAVGMNYALHNKELDGALYRPDEPVIVTNAASALPTDARPFF